MKKPCYVVVKTFKSKPYNKVGPVTDHTVIGLAYYSKTDARNYIRRDKRNKADLADSPIFFDFKWNIEQTVYNE